MAFTEFVPGMKPRSTVRNIIVGVVYLLFFYLIPFVLAYAVFTDRNGIADKLSAIPGISENGGAVSAVAIFLISLVVIGVVTAALPGEAPDTDGTSTGSDSGAENEDSAQSDDSTESEPSADEQQQQVDEADTDDAEGDEADAAETEAEEREFSDDELIPFFVSLVEGEGMSVETAEVQSGTFVVEYTSFAQNEQQLAGEIGYIAGTYAGMVGEGHTTDRMEVTILAINGEPAGTFYVEYEWADAFANDEMSDNEFSQRVVSTLESEGEGQARIQSSTNLAAI